MVPKPIIYNEKHPHSFRAVLFRMVPKQKFCFQILHGCFRAVLFRMVPKPLDVADYLGDKF